MSRSLALVVIISSGAACGGGLGGSQMENLTDSVRIYNDDVRWGRFEIAASFVPPKQRTKWVDDEDALSKNLRITEYDVVSVEPKGELAKVHIKVGWYKLDSATVHETHAMQTWERHGKNWVIVDETRSRGDEMPGLPEPLMTDDGSGSAR